MIHVLYHANCTDGFCSAWLLRRAFPDEGMVFHAMHYGDTLPEIENGSVVYIVDFSFKDTQPYIDLMSRECSLVIIDHHASAKSIINNLFGETQDLAITEEKYRNIFVVYNIDMSAAILTYTYIKMRNPDVLFQEYETLVKYIEDRDLWRFRLADSKIWGEYIQSTSLEFASYDRLAYKIHIKDDIVFKQAVGMLRHKTQLVNNIVQLASTAEIANFIVPCVNSSVLQSEVGNVLSLGKPFAIVYWIQGEYTYFSLRSDENGEDVSKVAEMMGGGGHKHAAGFRLKVAAKSVLTLDGIRWIPQ